MKKQTYANSCYQGEAPSKLSSYIKLWVASARSGSAALSSKRGGTGLGMELLGLKQKNPIGMERQCSSSGC